MSPGVHERSAARLLAEPGLEHDEAQAALAAAFGMTSNPLAPRARLDEASLPLFGCGSRCVAAQATALADALTNQLCLKPERRDHRALLIDHALAERSAHPLQIAVIGHELGRRAGVSTFVASYGGEFWTAVRGPEGLALVGAATIAGRPGAAEVRCRCPHQVAHAVLRQIEHAAPPEAAEKAARLLRSVPLSERPCP
ncbi:MAG TPA: hypothetical protein VMT37_16560 [Solirubrobacterales bacterium]|nr:hypothetical protein [Solirubrobacterales bacterium]